MKKTFKYRIFPSKAQTTKLQKSLDACRWLYNHLLEERKNAWESKKESISYYDQCKMFPSLKQEHSFLTETFSQCLLDVAFRIDLAFKAFFRRIKSGQKPGYPRFKGKGRYGSFTYTQSGFKLLNNVVRLSKIGDIKIKLHRPIEGQIKTCTIKRSSTGKWYVTFSCIVNNESKQQPIKPAIGIDMGLKSFATFSNRKKIKNPRFFKQEEKNLAKVQRKFSKQVKGSRIRKKARMVVARVYERTKWKRENFAHQESRKIVNKFNTIVVEDLNINNMKKDNFRCINKSIGDAAWKQFISFLSYKAEEAGKKVIKVNPAYTSQTCSYCGKRHKLKLSDRVFHCHCCNFSIDRDHNSARNILGLGLQSLGLVLRSPCLKTGE